MTEHNQDTSGGKTPLLELLEVSKHFGGVMALKHVSFTLNAGEIHGLVGENGAGKSTMVKIIAGVHHEFDGTMKIKGRDVRLRSAGDALANSIGMVHQELSVVPDLTVAENVFLGTQPLTAIGTVDWARMNRDVRICSDSTTAADREIDEGRRAAVRPDLHRARRSMSDEWPCRCGRRSE